MRLPRPRIFLDMRHLALDPRHLGNAPTLVVALGARNRLLDGVEPRIGGFTV
jgi:hypothetical protein